MAYPQGQVPFLFKVSPGFHSAPLPLASSLLLQILPIPPIPGGLIYILWTSSFFKSLYILHIIKSINYTYILLSLWSPVHYQLSLEKELATFALFKWMTGWVTGILIWMHSCAYCQPQRLWCTQVAIYHLQRSRQWKCGLKSYHSKLDANTRIELCVVFIRSPWGAQAK